MVDTIDLYIDTYETRGKLFFVLLSVMILLDGIYAS